MLKRKLHNVDDEHLSSKQINIDKTNLNYSVSNDPGPVTSKYFQKIPNSIESIEDQMLQLQIQFNNVLKTLQLKVPPIEYIYNPLLYAFDPYEEYIRKYCSSKKPLIFMGMNPGPFGMCQTGVPFGDPMFVKDFLLINGVVNKPDIECPFREILGFNSTRREQSGLRLWGFFQNLCGTAEKFFKNSVVLNFCPVAMMKQNGTNITPPDIKNIQVRKKLEAACDEWCIKVIQLLQPEIIVGIGKYIHKKSFDLLKEHNIGNIKVIYMPHPSPRATSYPKWKEKTQEVFNEHLTAYF